jgi:hypothetical protein
MHMGASSSSTKSAGDGNPVSTIRWQLLPLNFWQIKNYSIAVHVHHDMDIIVAIKACQSKRQYPGLGVILARPEESGAVPADVRKPPVVGLTFEIAAAPQCSISDSESNDLLAAPKDFNLLFP